MAESPPYADEATLYVLGLLGRRERRNFEARLKNSSELRALVRGLETGAVALTMATPRRDPPTRVWEGIQTAIAHESEKRLITSAFGSAWIRAALAIAACAMFGWFVYVLWFNRSAVVDAPPQVAVNRSVEDPDAMVSNPTVPGPRRFVPKSAPARQALRQTPAPLRTPLLSESATVQQKIADLESRVAYLSQSLTQQQVLPPGFSRVTFFNFDAASLDGAAGQAPTPSPELRRALLLALARQWGWLPSLEQNQNQQPGPTQASQGQGPQSAQQQRSEQRNPPATQIESGIAFVDLAPVNSDSPSPQTASTRPPSISGTASEDTSNLSSASENNVTSSASIPGFVSGTNLVLAFDSSVLPTGANTVSFSTIENGQSVFRGDVLLYGTPMVVSMPFRRIDDTSVGTWSGGSRTLNGFAPGQTAVLQVRAWDSTTGATFDGALRRGLSATFTYLIPQPVAPPAMP